MNVSTQVMVVLIVAIVVIGSILKPRISGRRGSIFDSRVGPLFDADPADDAQKQRLREEVQALKERVAVLERIATDSGSNLAREIEQLRDR